MVCSVWQNFVCGFDYVVVIFDKNYYINSDRFDNGDNKAVYASALYARRAIEDIAKAFGLKYFAMADDDIKDFVIRCPDDGHLRRFPVTDFDTIIDSYIDILDRGAVCTGFGIDRSYFGGVLAFAPDRLSSRIFPYNFFIRRADVEVNWTAWTAEDDITVLQSSNVGNLWLSIPHVMQVTPLMANVNHVGGNVELYQCYNKYTIYYTVIKYCPGRIYLRMNDTNDIKISRRTNNCFPKLISSIYRKEN